VELRSTGETLPVTPQAPAGQARKGGPRELRSQQLDVKLRPDHSLEEAVASGDAVLLVLPGPGEASERRTLKGAVLAFRWDEQERLTEVQGQKDAEFVGEPLPPAKGPARRIKSRNFVATVDPESGAAKSAEFNKDVRFERGNLEARAERASYDGAEAQLSLNEEPSLVDEEQGSRLQAETIEIFTRTGDIRARHSVRHTLERRGERAATIPGSESDTSVVSARLFDYEAKSRTARYRDGALLRSGRSELRAAEIRRVDASPDHRRLEAFGDVATLLYPRPKPGEAGQPPVDGRAQQMSYDEAKRELVYKGDVALVQGELRTKSPEAILLLGRETGELDRLEAFDPVELRQGTRIATGQRAVYTPADKTIVVTGDKAELKDEKQQAQGRTLTFFVGEDRILVDGREEGRTETILRRKPGPLEP
jgi:lipopolysaccharide export system protein LptA